MTVVLGSDHAGHKFKIALSEYLQSQDIATKIVGSHSEDRFDYPIASDEVAHHIHNHPHDFGILICGSGIGVSIRANRYPHIRAALCTTPQLAQLAREHNHANVLCLGERIITIEQAKEIVDVFLNAKPDLGERHVHRVQLLGTELVD